MNWTPEKIQQALSKPLPGRAAHDLLLPVRRPEPEEAVAQGKNPKTGAVMMLLYPHERQLKTVLMLRPEYEGVHSSQVSFPGGRQEPEDSSLSWTALRETREEIAVREQDIQVIASMTTLYIPPSNFIVHPFVGLVSRKPNFQPDPREVAAVIETDIDVFLKPDALVTEEVRVSGGGIRLGVKGFPVQGHFVWGATAMILMEFREALLRERQGL